MLPGPVVCKGHTNRSDKSSQYRFKGVRGGF